MTKYHIEGDFEVDNVGSVRKVGEKEWLQFTADMVDFAEHFGTEIKEPVTYEYGDRFRDKVGDECMIIRLSESECILAATTGNDRGNRYRDTAVHVHFVDAITQEELDSMAGPAYTPLTKIEEE